MQHHTKRRQHIEAINSTCVQLRLVHQLTKATFLCGSSDQEDSKGKSSVYMKIFTDLTDF